MKRVKYISKEANERLVTLLRDLGYDVVFVATKGVVADGLSCHPDMFLCRLGVEDDAEVVFAPEFNGSSDNRFAGSSGQLSRTYPADVAYNAACTGRFFIHALDYTAPELRARAEGLGLTFINVRQGYTKCSTVIVDERSIITYDKGIALPCGRAGMDVLLVTPGHVRLPGYDTGFLGGATGRVRLPDGQGPGRAAVLFNGNLDAHPDADQIRDFIQSRGLEVITIPDYPLTDIGSIV
ncbi:MAG: hypothetical protein IJH91_09070 [Mogibacterium sp.]|nr:hypothetical protein [Mogibacterium sp.]